MPYTPLTYWDATVSPNASGTLTTFNYPNLSAPASRSLTTPAPASVPAIGSNPATVIPANTNPNALSGPEANVASLPDIVALTNAINALNLEAQQKANMSRIPGEAGLEGQSSDLIKAELGGQVPADVENLLRQQGAEANVISGRDSNAAYLRALGLTSLGQEQAGQQNLSSAVARNPVAPIFDPSSQLITPYQQGQLGIEEQQLALEQQRLLRPQLPGGVGGGGGSPRGYSGTGGTAMGPIIMPSGGGSVPTTPGITDAGMAPGEAQNWQDALDAADELGGTPEEWFNYLQGPEAGVADTTTQEFWQPEDFGTLMPYDYATGE